MDMKIEKWQVENGIAKPVNPYNPSVTNNRRYSKKGDTYKFQSTNPDYYNFYIEYKDCEYATSAPPGIHSAEMFGEVKYQILNQTGKNGIYQDCSKEDFERWVGFMPRKFLPFNHPVEPNDKQPVEVLCWCETCGQDIVGNKCGCYAEKAQLVIGDTAFTKIKDGSIQIVTKNGCIELYPDELNELFNFIQPVNPNANAIKIVSERIELHDKKIHEMKPGANRDKIYFQREECWILLKLLQS